MLLSNRSASRILPRIVLMALAVIAIGHATPTFSTPTGGVALDYTVCSGATANMLSTPTPGIAGSPVPGGVALTGVGAFTDSSFDTCDIYFNWTGTGSGSFNGSNGTLDAVYNFTVPSNVSILGWNLSATVNGSLQSIASCGNTSRILPTAPSLVLQPRFLITNCVAPVSLPATSIPLNGASLSTYAARLQVRAQWSNATSSTVQVTIPGNATIDILTPAATSVPVLTPLAFAIFALLLFGLGLYLASGRHAASTPTTL